MPPPSPRAASPIHLTAPSRALIPFSTSNSQSDVCKNLSLHRQLRGAVSCSADPPSIIGARTYRPVENLRLYLDDIDPYPSFCSSVACWLPRRPVRPADGSKQGDGRRRKGLSSTYTVMYHVHASKHLRAGTALYNRRIMLFFILLVSSCVCSGRHCVVNMRELMNSRQAGRCRCCRARLQAAHTFDQNFAILAEFRR
jgi:hypothetical protein